MNLTPDFISKEEKMIEKIEKDMNQTALVYAILVCAA